MALWKALPIALCLPLTTAFGQSQGDVDYQLLGKPCASRAELVGYLGEKYEERQHSWHLINPKRLAELFTNYWSGTYSILITWPDGHSCLGGAGKIGEGT